MPHREYGPKQGPDQNVIRDGTIAVGAPGGPQTVPIEPRRIPERRPRDLSQLAAVALLQQERRRARQS